jgi:hypothetical protein
LQAHARKSWKARNKIMGIIEDENEKK